MAVDEGPYMHTFMMIEDESHGFMGNVSDVVGDVTSIVLPGGFRHLLDDAFSPSPCNRHILNNVIELLSGLIIEVDIKWD